MTELIALAAVVVSVVVPLAGLQIRTLQRLARVETKVEERTKPVRADGGRRPIEVPDAASEDETERDGLLSYAGEWHALAVGLGAGVAAAATGSWMLVAVVAGAALGVEAAARHGSTVNVRALGEVRREPWYALGGLVIGVAGGTLAAGVVA